MNEEIACESCGFVTAAEDVQIVTIPNGAWSGSWELCPDCAAEYRARRVPVAA